MGIIFGKQIDTAIKDKKEKLRRNQTTKQLKRFSSVIIDNFYASKSKKVCPKEQIDDQINLLEIKEALSNSVSSDQSENDLVNYNANLNKIIDISMKDENSSESPENLSDSSSNKSKKNQFKRNLRRHQD